MIKLRYQWFFLSLLNGLTYGTVPGCEKKLEWFEKRFITDTETFSLQVCCNVTKLWLGMLTNDWSIQLIPELNWVNINNLSMPGFDLILSKCPKGRVHLGEVLNNQCRLLRGHIATFSKGFDQYKLPEFENWYVTCLRVSGQAKGPCNVCKLHMYCTELRRCRKRYFQSDIVNATADTITLLVHVGDLPFRADIQTIVYTRDANNTRSTTTSDNSIVIQKNARALPRTSYDDRKLDYAMMMEYKDDGGGDLQSDQNYAVVHYTSTVEAENNRSFRFEVKDMALNSWFIIKTCLVVKTPKKFYENYPGLTLPSEDIFCLPDEGYKTPWSSTQGKNPYGRNGHAALCSCFFVIILTYFCRLFILRMSYL